MTIQGFTKEVEEELDEIASELGFNPKNQPLELKIRLINEKLLAFGFRQQSIEYIRGYVDRLEKQACYPDMRRLAAWAYLLMEEFQRTMRIDTSRHTTPIRTGASLRHPLGPLTNRESSTRSDVRSLVPPSGALVFENDTFAERLTDGRIEPSTKLAEILVKAREEYAWRAGKRPIKSQQRVIDLEEETTDRLQKLDLEKAHGIVWDVYSWGGGRKPNDVANATSTGKSQFEASIRNLLAGDVRGGLEILSEQPGIDLVMATKIYRFCCPETGAAVDRHCSYFFNSLPLRERGRAIGRCTGFKREWEDGKHKSSRLAVYYPSGRSHNLKEYLDRYLPILASIAETLNHQGDKYEYVCAATSKKKQWRPADVEMAAYQWWSRNGPEKRV